MIRSTNLCTELVPHCPYGLPSITATVTPPTTVAVAETEQPPDDLTSVQEFKEYLAAVVTACDRVNIAKSLAQCIADYLNVLNNKYQIIIRESGIGFNRWTTRAARGDDTYGTVLQQYMGTSELNVIELNTIESRRIVESSVYTFLNRPLALLPGAPLPLYLNDNTSGPAWMNPVYLVNAARKNKKWPPWENPCFDTGPYGCVLFYEKSTSMYTRCPLNGIILGLYDDSIWRFSPAKEYNNSFQHLVAFRFEEEGEGKTRTVWFNAYRYASQNKWETGKCPLTRRPIQEGGRKLVEEVNRVNASTTFTHMRYALCTLDWRTGDVVDEYFSQPKTE